jgi:CAAX prenyl protease-like protein
MDSVMVGVLVFAIWVTPDLFLKYRGHWLFQNPLTGHAASSLPNEVRHNLAFLAIRVLGSVLLVPVAEELFWRGWLMRWLIKKDFTSVPLGTWNASSFWLVAILFASEHGPYWEVGLAAGVIYNWWLVRTRTLADCILAHAITNGMLAAYVITRDAWEYWL